MLQCTSTLGQEGVFQPSLDHTIAPHRLCCAWSIKSCAKPINYSPTTHHLPLLCSALDRHDVKGLEAAIKVLEQPTLVSPGLRARALLLQAEALGTEASQPPPTAASEASAPVLRAFLATLQAVAICSGADILQQVGLTRRAEQGSFVPL